MIFLLPQFTVFFTPSPLRRKNPRVKLDLNTPMNPFVTSRQIICQLTRFVKKTFFKFVSIPERIFVYPLGYFLRSMNPTSFTTLLHATSPPLSFGVEFWV
jgi:hypothetical protein